MTEPGGDLLTELRAMYAQQWDTDERGQREAALWYWQDKLEQILGEPLFDEERPRQWFQGDEDE